jgi:hypothetical protein
VANVILDSTLNSINSMAVQIGASLPGLDVTETEVIAASAYAGAQAVALRIRQYQFDATNSDNAAIIALLERLTKPMIDLTVVSQPKPSTFDDMIADEQREILQQSAAPLKSIINTMDTGIKVSTIALENNPATAEPTVKKLGDSHGRVKVRSPAAKKEMPAQANANSSNRSSGIARSIHGKSRDSGWPLPVLAPMNKSASSTGSEVKTTKRRPSAIAAEIAAAAVVAKDAIALGKPVSKPGGCGMLLNLGQRCIERSLDDFGGLGFARGCRGETYQIHTWAHDFRVHSSK